MATYIYETVDPNQPPRQFELQQSMKDAPLTRHPETGEPIRRVITGGYGYAAKSGGPAPGGGGSCGTGCGCHN